MNKTLSFSEVLNVEELAPTELDAIVGGKFGIKIVGARIYVNVVQEVFSMIVKLKNILLLLIQINVNINENT